MKQIILQALRKLFKKIGFKSEIKHLNPAHFDKKSSLLNDTRLLGLSQRLSHFRSNNRSYPDQILDSGTVELLIKQFGGIHGQQTNLADSSLGFGLIHYSLIRIFKPERILCVGSEYGFVPALCALACRDNKKGKVDFVDAGKKRGEKNNWGGTGFWKTSEAKSHFNAFGLKPYIQSYIMTTQEFSKKHSFKYEYIYLDGDHSYDGIKHDFKKFWPLLAQQGLMVFHDINLKGLAHGDEYGVWKLWEQLEKQLPVINFPGFDNTLGVIQKNSEKKISLL